MQYKTNAIASILILSLLCIGIYNPIKAQDSIKYNPIQFSVNLDNMHLWRGYSVTNMPITNITVNYHTKNDMLLIGVWGGAGFTGEYRELDYFAQFNYKGLSVAVWDIYNFSSNLPWGKNPKLFDYNPTTTGHFIDLSVSYTLPIKHFPLKIYWSTILFGRDRPALPSDVFNVRSGRNQYTHFVELSCPVYQIKGYQFGLNVAGAFASINNHRLGNFYTPNNGFNIVSTGFTINKDFRFKNYTIPVGLIGMWNPANNHGNIQVSIGLFSVK